MAAAGRMWAQAAAAPAFQGAGAGENGDCCHAWLICGDGKWSFDEREGGGEEEGG